MTKSALGILLLVLMASAPLRAEVPMQSKAELLRGATHIVGGKVQMIYSVAAASDGSMVTKSVAAIAVQKIEKGDRIQPGGTTKGGQATCSPPLK